MHFLTSSHTSQRPLEKVQGRGLKTQNLEAGVWGFPDILDPDISVCLPFLVPLLQWWWRTEGLRTCRGLYYPVTKAGEILTGVRSCGCCFHPGAVSTRVPNSHPVPVLCDWEPQTRHHNTCPCKLAFKPNALLLPSHRTAVPRLLPYDTTDIKVLKSEYFQIPIVLLI